MLSKIKRFINSFKLQLCRSEARLNGKSEKINQQRHKEMEEDFTCVLNTEHNHKFEVIAKLHGSEVIIYQGNDVEKSMDMYEIAHKKYSVSRFYQGLRWSVNHHEQA
jgi:hypothetical protein